MSANLIFINFLYPHFESINQQHSSVYTHLSLETVPHNSSCVQGRHWGFKLTENVAEFLKLYT